VNTSCISITFDFMNSAAAAVAAAAAAIALVSDSNGRTLAAARCHGNSQSRQYMSVAIFSTKYPTSGHLCVCVCVRACVCVCLCVCDACELMYYVQVYISIYS